MSVAERAFPRALPAAALPICGGLAGLGVVAFVVGLWTDADTAWRAFHVNYLYFAGQGWSLLADNR